MIKRPDEKEMERSESKYTNQAGAADEASPDKGKVTFRRPTLEDGSAIWNLVDHCKPLDLNSCYAYLLVCRDFSETSVVAEDDGEVVGFISAYIPPPAPDVVFVWQVAVHSSQRGRKLAGRMLQEIMRCPACKHVRYLETTVTPSNKASMALFHSFARDADSNLDETEGFPARLFGGAGAHEDERLLRIGPIETVAVPN